MVCGHPCKFGKLAIFYHAKKIKKFTFSIVFIRGLIESTPPRPLPIKKHNFNPIKTKVKEIVHQIFIFVDVSLFFQD